jgi:glycosyltransferase involved in cell wall biosynthesis
MFKGNLSVFFPAFNEAENIRNTVQKAIKVLEDLKIPKWEVIVVNDGSTDNTREVAEDMAKENSKVKVVNQPNGGYGEALRGGFRASQYEWICYNDGDGQFDFSEIVKFLDLTDQADLILGYRIERKDPWIRLLFAKGWLLTVFIFFGLRFKDIDCGFKLVKKELIERIAPLESSRGAMINAELVIKAKTAGFRIKQIGVHHYPRRFGKPTGASLRVIIKSYLDLVKMRWQVK